MVEGLTAGATLLLVLVTLGYAYFTRELVKSQTRPRIALIFGKAIGAGDREYITLKFENIGLGPAYDIKFTIEPANYEYEPGKSLKDVKPLAEGITYLAQGRHKSFRLHDSAFIPNQNPQIKVIAKYKDANEKELTDISYLSYSMIEESEFSLVYLSSDLKSMEITIRQMASVLSQIKNEIGRLNTTIWR